MSGPRRPPPPIPRPGHVQVVRAMYNYTAQQVLKYSDPSDFFRSIAP